MKVHHLNCGTMRPLGGKLIDGRAGYLRTAEMVCHCLLVETGSGLVLVDTGVGAPARRKQWLGTGFPLLVGAKVSAAETMTAHIERLGYSPSDVRHVLLTHLDLDHTGGLVDFPNATVHVYADELDAMRAPTLRERARYRQIHFSHQPKWQAYDTAGSDWFGFRSVRELDGLPDFRLVPLAGHTRGHTGVAVDTGSGWLLHAGDSYFFHGELDPARPHCTPGLKAFQAIVEIDRRKRLDNQVRLRELARDHRDEVTVFSAHCAEEFRRLSTASR